MSLDFSLVIPTYNEAQGLRALVERLCGVLQPGGFRFELVVVDDNSPDGTGQVAEQLARELPLKVVHRTGKLGLASAVIDGWQRSEGAVLGVIDADLSHDPDILPVMLSAVLRGGADVAVGSRYVPGGGMRDWPLYRQVISRVACFMGYALCPVRDVTSGYLCFRREVIQGVRLDPIGFKIGLEVLVRGRYRTFVEVPYIFRDRTAGQSKLSLKVIQAYLIQLGRLLAFSLRDRQIRIRLLPHNLAR
ncbi:MAG: polyprenol monophosphomannose synthase [Candidatus Eremiobacterota bacterium]